ncbi:MAG TPA: redoxin domain-containing protein [Longimicrobiales bacterium]|nr:redoxin domain-containing protein [Longimicrobiales bacterium]
MTRRSHRLLGLAATAVLAVACGSDTSRVALGPVDGRDLPPADTGRVAVGDPAPDFSLRSFDDGVVTLSDFRGRKDVVLVFYRGHW